jgi:hypothetical protein
MTKYLSIAMGETPRSAETVFASDDQELIELVLACVLRRLDMLEPEPEPRRTLAYAH